MKLRDLARSATIEGKVLVNGWSGDDCRVYAEFEDGVQTKDELFEFAEVKYIFANGEILHIEIDPETIPVSIYDADGNFTEEAMKIIKEAAREETRIDMDEEGNLSCELYPNYDDEISPQEILRICESDDPELLLTETVEEMFMDEASDILDNATTEACDALFNANILYDDTSDSEDIRAIREFLEETIEFIYPYDHFENQLVKADIYLDGTSICAPEENSLFWLARQQGYSNDQMSSELEKPYNSDPHGFLETAANEGVTHDVPVAFLVQLHLGELCKIAYAAKSKSEKEIELTTGTRCGQFDPYSGTCGELGIELDKNVIIPANKIWKAIPDVKDGGFYGIDSICGLLPACWAETLVKGIE